MYAHLIILKGDVPSKKNSKQIFFNRRTGRRFISTSDSYKVWHRQASIQLLKELRRFDIVNKLVVKFFPSNRRSFDLSNKFESIADLLVDNKIIPDDNYRVLPKVEIQFIEVDRQNPRSEIYFYKSIV